MPMLEFRAYMFGVPAWTYSTGDSRGMGVGVGSNVTWNLPLKSIINTYTISQ